VFPLGAGTSTVNLDDILEGIPPIRTSFSTKYRGLTLSVWQLKRVDFQHLEDKCVGKLPTWNGKYVIMVGRTALGKSVITSQGTYYSMPLVFTPGTFRFINKIERDFLWSAKEATIGTKFKVNWKRVCCPINLKRIRRDELGQVCVGTSPSLVLA
jgi:hypothetical protein